MWGQPWAKKKCANTVLILLSLKKGRKTALHHLAAFWAFLRIFLGGTNKQVLLS
jgi:hypothetical protein